MTRAASPRLRVYAGLAATALMAALVTGRPQLAVLATPFALLVAVALAGEPLALEGELRLDRDRVLEGDRLRATLAVDNRGGGARVDVHLPAAARLDSDPTPIGFWLARGERRELSVRARGPALGRARRRSRDRPRERPARGDDDRRTAGRGGRREGLRRRRTAAQDRRAAPHQAGPGQPGLARAGRGDRVRRSCARWRRATASAASTGARPHAAAHRTSTSSIPSTARTWCCSSTRSRRQSSRTRERSTRRARRRGARLHLPRPARPRGAREPRRGAEMAYRQPRHAAAVSHPRRAVLQRGEAELPMEGGHTRAAPAAPGAGPGDRAEPTAGRARDRARCSSCAPAGTTSSSSRSRRSGTRGATTSRSVSGGFSATRCARASRRSAFRSRTGSPRAPASSWRSRR